MASHDASVNGRETNTQAVLIDGVAMHRLIVVTDADVTITVVTQTKSGAEGTTQFPATSRGDIMLNATNVEFTTSDSPVNIETRTMIAFGIFNALDSRNGARSIGGTLNDTILVTQTITLAPDETRSLLQFAMRSDNDADGGGDLNLFTRHANGLAASGLLAGLPRGEQLSIINYPGLYKVQPPSIKTNCDGSYLGISLQRHLFKVEHGTLTEFQ